MRDQTIKRILINIQQCLFLWVPQTTSVKNLVHDNTQSPSKWKSPCLKGTCNTTGDHREWLTYQKQIQNCTAVSKPSSDKALTLI